MKKIEYLQLKSGKKWCILINRLQKSRIQAVNPRFLTKWNMINVKRPGEDTACKQERGSSHE